MTEMCAVCGLPDELCTCEALSLERQRIKIRTVQRKFRKKMTVISGLDSSMDIKRMGKELKRNLATGGTVKDGTIELQGDRSAAAKKFLLKQGFTEEQIDVL